MSDDGEYEWGVLHNRSGEAHRTGMDEDEARQWITEWKSDGGLPGAFSLIRRFVGEWETTP